MLMVVNIRAKTDILGYPFKIHYPELDLDLEIAAKYSGSLGIHFVYQSNFYG